MQAVHHCAAGRPWTVLAYRYRSSNKLGHRSRASTNSRAPIALRFVDHNARRSPGKNLLHAAYNLQENVPASASGREVVKLKFVLHKKCEFGQQFSVVGDHEVLGSWDPEAAVLMEWSEGHVWATEVELPVEERVEFKVILKDDEGVVEWQPGPNLVLETSQALAPSVVLVSWSSEESMQQAVPLAQVVDMNTLLDNNELKESITAGMVLTEKIDEVGGAASNIVASIPDIVDVDDTIFLSASEKVDDVAHTKEQDEQAEVPMMLSASSTNDTVKDIPEAPILSTVTSTQKIGESQTANQTIDKEVAFSKLTESTESTVDELAESHVPDAVGVKIVVNAVNGQRVLNEPSTKKVNGTVNFQQTLTDPDTLTEKNAGDFEVRKAFGTVQSAARLEDINNEQPEDFPMSNTPSETKTEVLEDDTADVSLDTVIDRDLGWGRSTLSAIWAALLQRRKRMV